MKRCNLCGSEKILTIHRLSNRNILRCSSCDLVFADLECVDINSYYDKKYSDMILNDFRLDLSHRDYAEKMLHKINKFKKSGKILDIGCGPGFFLDCARNQRWQTFGVELADSNFKYARDIFGLNMINSDIEYLSFEENYFDVITMWDVIEHIKNPTTILKKIYKLLNFDGLLCIETPNNDSIYHLILKKEWISFREISHIYFYSPETLTRILNKVGFKAVKIETENVNFFSMEGLRRFSMNTYAYDLKLVLNKLSEILINNNCVKYKKEKDRSVNFFTEFRNKFTELANYPTNLLFNYLLMGDQLRIFCKKM